ncbi:MAG: glycosyltransferase family 4 protein [Firmicutes bacterium]|nr:glycosyltransferase family 4 protein [Bacillota bacterium]
MIRIAAYTGGINVPSARFRVRQYIPVLRNLGLEISEFTSKWGAYPPPNRFVRPLWALGSLGSRICGVINSYRCDITWLQREMLSTLVTLEPFTKRPRVLDVDDAIWLHRRRGDGFARRLAGLCDGVICGNAFLAGYFGQWNANVHILPTAVDTEHYKPVSNSSTKQPVIGWSGTSSGFSYLRQIEPALAKVLKDHPRVQLRVVSDRRPELNSIPAGQFRFIPWSPGNEVQAVQDMTIGIMPLRDSLWEQGKCSYKMLLYMACGIPVVASPVGMNAELLSINNIGFGPAGEDEWVDALHWLLQNPAQAMDMGSTGRHTVLKYYSLQVLAPKLANMLESLAGRKRSLCVE